MGDFNNILVKKWVASEWDCGIRKQTPSQGGASKKPCEGKIGDTTVWSLISSHISQTPKYFSHLSASNLIYREFKKQKNHLMILKWSQAFASQKVIIKKKHSDFPSVFHRKTHFKESYHFMKGRAKPLIFRMWKWKSFLYHSVPCAVLHTVYQKLGTLRDKTQKQSRWGWNLRYKHLPFF